MIPLDCGLEFDPARDEEFFAALPARPAVFLTEPRHPGAEPYLSRTADLRRRLERLLRPPEPASKRLNLREFAAGVHYRLTGSNFEQALVHYQHARQIFPWRYRDLLGLRLPALLKVNLANAYPRCYVTRRILTDAGFYFGPFPTRKTAANFANEFLNFFRMRRCQIKIRRDPHFPGCIYSEMKMCLAPCFAGCTKAEYDVEVSRVLGFLTTGGASLSGELEHERERACEALDFERAAAIHRKLEKVAGMMRGLPELARKVNELDAVVLVPAAEESTIALFGIRGGLIADPFYLRFNELASQPRSVEEILRQQLSALPEPTGETAETVVVKGNAVRTAPPDILCDHLSLLARWFYSHPRSGEIFSPNPDWPYRRIIRACSRLLNPQTSLPFSRGAASPAEPA